MPCRCLDAATREYVSVSCTRILSQATIVLVTEVISSTATHSPLPCNASTLPYAAKRYKLVALQEESLAAEEWQLSWSIPERSSSAACAARVLLKMLRVNPIGVEHFPAAVSSDCTADVDTQLASVAQPVVPPQLPVPWALAFTSAHVELTLMASSSVLIGTEALPRETLVVNLLDTQVKLL